MNSRLIILLGFLFILSCKEDDVCLNETKIEGDALSTEALDFNPYNETDKIAVFKDDSGSEYRFGIEHNEVKIFLNHVSGFCYEAEFYRLYLRGMDIDLFFHFWVGDVPKPNAQGAQGEDLKILMSQTEGESNIDALCLYHSINIKDVDNNLILRGKSLTQDSLVLNGQAFYDVILNNDFEVNPVYDAYYNKEFGIVGFKNTADNITYHLDRIEE